MPCPAPFKTATIQFEPTMFAKEQNVASLLKMCEEAAQGGAKLIVTPEMGTTGYCWYDRSEVAPHVEPIPGPTTSRFHDIAARHGIYSGLCCTKPVRDSPCESSAITGGDE
ncbi:nitrilase-related carbon-nitrogen hydrolase, partial [Salipiger sp. 1_MG-2023]|uniref:nitrilase-related carbon-nitrogen hydrolase n=1 Tax=Salipiger sp. 1_MG-2023 TaxID=3062665 RepID=UPI0026E3E1E2